MHGEGTASIKTAVNVVLTHLCGHHHRIAALLVKPPRVFLTFHYGKLAVSIPSMAI